MGSDILAGAFLCCIITGERMRTKGEYTALIQQAQQKGIDTDSERKKYGLGAYEQLKNMIL